MLMLEIRAGFAITDCVENPYAPHAYAKGEFSGI